MKANAASFDITPTRPLDQGAGTHASGVSVENLPSEPLEANLLVLWPGPDDEPILLVTLDLLYPGPAIREAVELAAFPVPPERVVVAASHTHRAPMTDEGKPLLGATDSEYLAWLTAEVARHVKKLLEPGQAWESRLRVGATQASHSINRRQLARWSIEGKRLHRNVVLAAPNRTGSVDETVIVAAVHDATGSPLAMLWNYACHPVAHPDPHAYSSHYIHHVRMALRELPGAHEVPVLFFQGFSGDTRPRASVRTKGWKSWIKHVVSGPRFRTMTPKRYLAWASSLAEEVASVDLVESDIGPSVEARRLLQPGNEFAEGLHAPVAFQTIRFSSNFILVGMSGEAVSEYAPFVRRQTGAEFTMCVGCLDDVFGYVPTARMLTEGGYEGADFVHKFALRSVAPEIETNTKHAFQTLLEPTE